MGCSWRAAIFGAFLTLALRRVETSMLCAGAEIKGGGAKVRGQKGAGARVLSLGADPEGWENTGWRLEAKLR